MGMHPDSRDVPPAAVLDSAPAAPFLQDATSRRTSTVASEDFDNVLRQAPLRQAPSPDVDSSAAQGLSPGQGQLSNTPGQGFDVISAIACCAGLSPGEARTNLPSARKHWRDHLGSSRIEPTPGVLSLPSAQSSLPCTAGGRGTGNGRLLCKYGCGHAVDQQRSLLTKLGVCCRSCGISKGNTHDGWCAEAAATEQKAAASAVMVVDLALDLARRAREFATEGDGPRARALLGYSANQLESVRWSMPQNTRFEELLDSAILAWHSAESTAEIQWDEITIACSALEECVSSVLSSKASGAMTLESKAFAALEAPKRPTGHSLELIGCAVPSTLDAPVVPTSVGKANHSSHRNVGGSSAVEPAVDADKAAGCPMASQRDCKAPPRQQEALLQEPCAANAVGSSEKAICGVVAPGPHGSCPRQGHRLGGSGGCTDGDDASSDAAKALAAAAAASFHRQKQQTSRRGWFRGGFCGCLRGPKSARCGHTGAKIPLSMSPNLASVSSTASPQEKEVGSASPVLQGERLCLARDFKRGETIGAGSQGCVFTARHSTSGQIVAVKELFLDRLAGGRGTALERLARELRLCEQLDHVRIVRYFGHEFVIGAQGGPERVFLYLEYCSGGSLAAHLRNYGPLDAQLLKKYTAQLLEGLIYLHSRTPPVVHRDLKCANLLLTHDANVKITDFGCSKLLQSDQEKLGAESEHSMVGSVFWMAPEVLRARRGLKLTRAVDIWSLGCCLVEMCTGEPPWCERKFDNFLQAGHVIAETDELPRLPEEVSDGAASFVRACLRRNPQERPTALELQAQPLIGRGS